LPMDSETCIKGNCSVRAGNGIAGAAAALGLKAKK